MVHANACVIVWHFVCLLLVLITVLTTAESIDAKKTFFSIFIFTMFFILKTLEKWHTEIKMTFSFVV